jgi:hypothetical protein
VQSVVIKLSKPGTGIYVILARLFTMRRSKHKMSALPPIADIDRVSECRLGANSGHHLYSITSSARASSGGGISMPSAFAVPRLMTSSKFGRLLYRDIPKLRSA